MFDFLTVLNIFFAAIAMVFVLELCRFIRALFGTGDGRELKETVIKEIPIDHAFLNGDKDSLNCMASQNRTSECSISVIDQSSGKEISHPLHFDDNIIGRSQDRTEFLLDDKKISRLHFKITVDGDGRAFISDYNSKNGTWVNGERLLNAPVELRNGDKIFAGDTLFRYNA